jgi:ADP-ribose pyrophosphatase YjhB (NUDIX family)
MPKRHSHCSSCGKGFSADQAWPRTCAGCGTVCYLNPIPVVVVLLPVHDSVLLVRRAIEPQSGLLALPGGYIDHGETWQQAAVREVKEECGVAIRVDELTVYDVISQPDDLLLIVALSKVRTASGLPRFKPNAEVSELVLASSPLQLAFPAHSQALKRYLTSRQGQGQTRVRRRTSQSE